MKPYRVSLEQMLDARERRAAIQSEMLSGVAAGKCLVCLTMNIAGDIKRTPMIRMLFDSGVERMESSGFDIIGRKMIDGPTGCEAFWLLSEEGETVKPLLEAMEDSFDAARLFDFDVLVRSGAGMTKLSRETGRKCLICDAPAAECARSRRHGLDAIRRATDDLIRSYCARALARAAYESLLDEVYTTPKPGLVDRLNCGAHNDMDVPLFEKSASSLITYFEDAARLGMSGCDMKTLRERGIEAEEAMFAATGGVNTHKGLIYSMGLLLAGMGMSLVSGGSCTEHASSLAVQDAGERLADNSAGEATNGGAAYRRYGARGAVGEASAGFPDALYCLSRLSHYRNMGCDEPGALAFCDSMARLEDTNLLHRGGSEGLEFARNAASAISALPEGDRIEELIRLDEEMIWRGLSPGGSADMLALAYMLERWQRMTQHGRKQ